MKRADNLDLLYKRQQQEMLADIDSDEDFRCPSPPPHQMNRQPVANANQGAAIPNVALDYQSDDYEDFRCATPTHSPPASSKKAQQESEEPWRDDAYYDEDFRCPNQTPSPPASPKQAQQEQEKCETSNTTSTAPASVGENSETSFNVKRSAQDISTSNVELYQQSRLNDDDFRSFKVFEYRKPADEDDFLYNDPKPDQKDAAQNEEIGARSRQDESSSTAEMADLVGTALSSDCTSTEEGNKVAIKHYARSELLSVRDALNADAQAIGAQNEEIGARDRHESSSTTDSEPSNLLVEDTVSTSNAAMESTEPMSSSRYSSESDKQITDMSVQEMADLVDTALSSCAAATRANIGPEYTATQEGNKVAIKRYARNELLSVRKSLNADQWLTFLWVHHGREWDVNKMPFELDSELRCSFHKQLRIKREREADNRRWHCIAKGQKPVRKNDGKEVNADELIDSQVLDLFQKWYAEKKAKEGSGKRRKSSQRGECTNRRVESACDALDNNNKSPKVPPSTSTEEQQKSSTNEKDVHMLHSYPIGWDSRQIAAMNFYLDRINARINEVSRHIAKFSNELIKLWKDEFDNNTPKCS